MTSCERPPLSNAGRNVSVESFPYVVDDRYYFRRMKEILQDGLLPKPSLPVQQDQLSDHVFIGNQRNADDVPGLRSAGIDHVLSCAASRRSTESPYDAGSGIVDYFLIPAEDRDDFDITRYFDAAFLFLDRVKRRRGRALVHCNMGVNRSGAIVAAYLMVDETRNLLDVIAYLKAKRRLVLSNKGFRIQLIQFARSRGLLDPVVDTVTRISYMDERRRAKSEENDERRRRTKTPPAVRSDDRASFRPPLRDAKHEQSTENEAGAARGEREAGNANGKWKQRDGVIPRSSNNDLALNGNDSDMRISTATIQSVTSNFHVAPPKYSSSFQYWPKIETTPPPPPPPSKVTGSAGNSEVRQPGAKTDPASTVTKRRRYVRTRSDSRTGVEGGSENQAAPNRTEPHKLLSTIFCTIRAKPKRDAAVSKQSYIVDGLQRLQVEDKNSTKYHLRDTAPRFSLGNSSSVPDEVPVNFRPRCPSGTASSSSTRTRNTNIGDGGGGSGTVEKVSSGFLVLLGKKVVHAKSSSQWNLSALDRDTEPLFSKESGRTVNFTGSRKRLNELSGIGTPWRSVEKISESSNVYLIRKDFF